MSARGGLLVIRRAVLPVTIAFASAGIAFLLSIGIPTEIPFLRTAQLRTIDQRFEYRGPLHIKDTSKVVIVAIDEPSLEALPISYPFPRRYYARAIQNLYDAGAKAVGIDIVMDDSSHNRADDSLFAAAVADHRQVVLAGRVPRDYTQKYKILMSENYFSNIFVRSGSSVGIVNVLNDPDGVCRRYMPIIDTGTEQFGLVPSFGLALVSRYLNLKGKTATDEKSYFRLGGIRIPKYDQSSMLINYPGPAGSNFRTYHFWEVMDDSAFTTRDETRFGVRVNYYEYLRKKGVFKNKIVLIGAMYPESHDLEPVPFSRGKRSMSGNLAYGVEVHASAIETVLDGDFLKPASPWVNFIEMLIGALIIACTSFLFRSARHSRMFLAAFVPLLVTGVIATASYEGAFTLFAEKGIVMQIIYPILAFGFSYVGTVVYQFASERRQKTAIRSLFSRYVDPSVVNHLVGNPELVKLGGERKIMTVLFSDIANFTGVSEGLAPERLVSHLNDYLTSMTGVIFKHSGTLDKYIGDAIIAFWGAPIEVENHAHQACRAAFEMRRKLGELHAKWRDEGLPLLNFRVGINSGEMVVGNIGGKERFDYTVIGDSVNLASRLESANKTYRTHILLSEYTYGAVKGDMIARELDLIVVKGRIRPVKIYELISDSAEYADEKKEEAVAFYLDGLSKFREREWSSAAEYFKRALSLDPDDYPSRMYLERCGLFQADPPPVDWNGVFVMQTK